MATAKHVPANKRILRQPETSARTGYSRPSLYRLEAAGRFPKRIKLGVNAMGYLEEEVDAWIEERIRASRAAA